ncbi:homeobox protein OTX2-like [Ruditapes philippinarum]|uniref:homeobox protein OTX2-like n=1 Tax=Ruditapes philippinarum TaxID=129788 RepID=UPI00295AE2BB|nr:homeobox protein OTX2-like [Ruditapes philippinarum]
MVDNCGIYIHFCFRMANRDNKENLVPKRQRIKYKPEQVEVLERLFEENHYPDTFRQEQLALDLGITLDRISIWFQNRRSKFKRQRQADHMAWMRKQIFQSKDDHNNGIMFGTPKLPALSSACHVLSPIETRIPRDDSTADLNSVSSSPCMLNNISRPLPHENIFNYNHDQTTTCRYETNMTSAPAFFLTPTRTGLEYDYTSSPNTMLQHTHVPVFDMFHFVSSNSSPAYVPSMHAVAQNHVTRSRLDENELNKCAVNEQQPQMSSEVHTNFNSKKCPSLQRADNSFGENSRSIINASERDVIWLDTDSGSSPTKDTTLDCLAHWC